jgi:thymidine phosphorylase
MDIPLGRAAGNWLEVKESVACLEKGKPRTHAADPNSSRKAKHQAEGSPADLHELVVACAAHLLVQTGKASSLEAARQVAEDCLASGKPRAKWNEMLIAQGADLAALEKKLAREHTAPVVVELKAHSSGYVADCDARILGEVVRELGGGRLTKDSVLNYDVGVDWIAKPGEPVHAGGVLARVHAGDKAQAGIACDRLKTAFAITAAPAPARPLIEGVIGMPE